MITDIPRSSRVCAATSRELKPGETFYSVLLEDKEIYKRLDYSLEGWAGPPQERIGYWRSKVPGAGDKKPKLAPNDILLNFFDQLLEQPGKEDICYVLVLLLVRRRLFRLENEEKTSGDSAKHLMTVYCPKRDTTYTVLVEVPPEEKIEELQTTLAGLIYTS